MTVNEQRAVHQLHLLSDRARVAEAGVLFHIQSVLATVQRKNLQPAGEDGSHFPVPRADAPMRYDTGFLFGSVTKLLTTTLVLQQVERGANSWSMSLEPYPWP